MIENGDQPKDGIKTSPHNIGSNVQTPQFRKPIPPPPPPPPRYAISMESLPQFQTDYTISWDTGSGDCTCVTITKISRDGTMVVGEIIGTSHKDSGCISLRQAVEAYEERKRLEEREKKT